MLLDPAGHASSAIAGVSKRANGYWVDGGGDRTGKSGLDDLGGFWPLEDVDFDDAMYDIDGAFDDCGAED